MTLPTSRKAYEAYYEIFDRAIESERGVSVRVASIGSARQLRTRLHYARSLDRKLSRDLYDLNDPKHGVSTYDHLVVTIETEGDDVVVRVQPAIATFGEIEEITT